MTPPLVACNIYISAARKGCEQMLLQLLKNAQERCRLFRQGNISPDSTSQFKSKNDDESSLSVSLSKTQPNKNIAIVHAYADIPYDRSSIHLAGNSDCVADMASYIAINAIDSLTPTFDERNIQDGKNKSDESRHPLVGIVDHIAIMPLHDESSCDQVEKKEEINSSCAVAAHYVGKILSQKDDVEILYYGNAHAYKKSLATIRREYTNFFKSGALDLSTKEMDSVKSRTEICTVGSSSSFIENYNIRLSPNVHRKECIALARKIRERDGGVVGVEVRWKLSSFQCNIFVANKHANNIIDYQALTLPYSQGRFEVACNLLLPEYGSTKDIDHKIDEWIKDLKTANRNKSGADCSNLTQNKDYHVEESYRVGTTNIQCLNVSKKNHDIRYMKEHDLSVLQNFRLFLQS